MTKTEKPCQTLGCHPKFGGVDGLFAVNRALVVFLCFLLL